MEKELPRLQKTLAAAGVASRRACEALIAEGRVQVNGKIVREMGLKVDPEKDEIRVDGQPIARQQAHKPLYLMLNKPVGYTSTVSDPHAERTVLELLIQIEERIYPVGRLDVDSEGLLLLTNDGEFANRLTHPRYHVPKLYRVRARGFVGREAATRLAEGMELEDGKTAPAEVRFLEYDTATQCTIIEVTLYEGRNRQVRRMFDMIGHPVRQLTRVGFGTLRLQNLNPGTWRKLRPEEIEALLALAQPTPTPPKGARRAKPSGPYRPRNAGRGGEAGFSDTTREETANPVGEQFIAPTRPAAPNYPSAPARPFTPGRPPAPIRPGAASRPASPSQSAMPPRPGAHVRPAASSRPNVSSRPAASAQPASFARPFRPSQPAAFVPRAKPAQAGGPTRAERRAEPPKNQNGATPAKPTARPKRPAGPVDFSGNSAAGRKAGLPFQPRPKQGHRAFGRAKP